MSLLSLLLVPCLLQVNIAHAASPSEWKEVIRGYALKMITEGFRKYPENAQLQLLGYRLQEAKLSETHARYYAYTTIENQKVFLNPILREMKLELAAETLVHEAGHLIGLRECEADELSGFVVRNSKSSHGIRISTNLVSCPKVMESTCGEPVLFDRDFRSRDLTQISEKELNRLESSVEVSSKNASFQFFLVQRIQGWVGGDACSQIYENDFNQNLKVHYSDFFAKRGFAPVIDYLNAARRPYLQSVRDAALKFRD